MIRNYLGIVGAAALLTFSAMPASASIQDLGSVVATSAGASVYFNDSLAANITSFNDYAKFQVSAGDTPYSINASLTDSFTKGKLGLIGATFSLFSCTTHCTGTTLAPTGTLLGSAPVTTITATSQSATIPQVDGLTSLPGYYFLELAGTKQKGSGTFVSSTATAVVAGVPETSTWVMMMLGFAGLGFAGFRSRRTANLAA